LIGLLIVIGGLMLFGGYSQAQNKPSTASSPTPSGYYPGVNVSSATQSPSQTVVPTLAPVTDDYSSYSITPTDTPRDYQDDTPVPIVTPVPPTSKTCTTSGDYTTCSDGTSYITSGSYTTINGGSSGQSGSCITSGDYVNCSDGSSAINNGDYSSYSGNGKNGTCIRNGAWTNCSDGTSTYNANY